MLYRTDLAYTISLCTPQDYISKGDSGFLDKFVNTLHRRKTLAYSPGNIVFQCHRAGAKSAAIVLNHVIFVQTYQLMLQRKQTTAVSSADGVAVVAHNGGRQGFSIPLHVAASPSRAATACSGAQLTTLTDGEHKAATGGGGVGSNTILTMMVEMLLRGVVGSWAQHQAATPMVMVLVLLVVALGMEHQAVVATTAVHKLMQVLLLLLLLLLRVHHVQLVRIAVGVAGSC